MDLSDLPAGWIAIACLVVALAVVAAVAARTWAAWRRTSAARHAALALLDVHQERLDAAIGRAGDHAGTLAEGGEALAADLSELRTDVAHLRWLLGAVPAAREHLRDEVLRIVLPTREQETSRG